MALKIYRSKKYMSLSVPLTVGDKVMAAEFKGGRINPRVCGCFVTMDSDVQRALEQEPGFGKDFELERIVEEPVSDRKQSGATRTQEGGQQPQADMSAQGMGTCQPLNGVEVVGEVTRVQEAADYLSERYGISRIEVNTKAKIVAFIADKDIVFPNLNLGDDKK